jgi:hypothetical protein
MKGGNLDKDKGGSGLSKEQTLKNGTDKNQKTTSVRRASLVFERKEGEGLVGNGDTIPQCANLLQAMELNGFGDEEENKSIDGDEESMMLLPEEWVYSETSVLTGRSLSQDREGLLEELKGEKDMDKEKDPKVGAKKKDQKEKKENWGPVVVERRCQRYADDNRTILEKAQEAKRKWNEEDPKGKTKQKPLHINSADLIYTVVIIGLTSKDGNPIGDETVRKIVVVEEQRYETAIKNYKADTCNPPVDTEEVAESSREQGFASGVSGGNTDSSQLQEGKINAVAGRGRRNTRNRNNKKL